MSVPLSSSSAGWWWQPTHCTLQLQFTAANNAVILPGCSYKGISSIRYRKSFVDLTELLSSPEGSINNAPSVFQIPQHVDQFRSHGSSKGLHLHALTMPPSSSPKVLPLVIQKYKLTCLGNGKSDSTRVSPSCPRRGDVLKISTVVTDEGGSGKEEQRNISSEGKETIAAQRTSGGSKGSKRNQKEKITNAKNDKSGKKGKSSAVHQETDDCKAERSSPEMEDAGSKLIYFENEELFPEGAEVELSVSFTAQVQGFDQGGVFVPARVTGSDGIGMLLTHFEVRLARLAFPCPDHPVYRLIWTLQSIQLPDAYGKISVQHCVFANAPCIKKTMLPHQRAVQYGFASCGPIPAYLVAFAFFTQPLTMQTKKVPSPRYPVSAYMETPLHEAAPHSSVPTEGENSLTLRVATTVPCDLSWVLRVFSDALERMEAFFLSSIPLFILLNDDEYADNGDEDERTITLKCEQGDNNEEVETHLSPRRELTVLIAPTMPYISGMEHQGLICLNESIFSSSGANSSTKNNSAKNKEEKELERAMLIVHEIAHHWIGNAIGVPFSIKEGLCQLIEQHFGPLIIGRPVKAVVQRDATDVTDPEQGKEFTLNTYRHALQALEFIASSKGFLHVQQGLRWLVREYVVRPAYNAEVNGDFLLIASEPFTGSLWPVAPYLSSAAVLRVLMSSSLPTSEY